MSHPRPGDRVRFGIIGAGNYVEACHAPGLAEHPDVDLVGIWSRDPAKAAAVAERHGTVGVPDLDVLLASVDAIAIAIDPAAQADYAVRAAEAGCHLLMEKAMTLTVDDSRRIVDAVERTGVASIVHFSWRFMESFGSWMSDTVLPGTWDAGTAELIIPLPPRDPSSPPVPPMSHVSLWSAAPHLLAVLLPALGPVAEVVAVESGHDVIPTWSGLDVRLDLRHESGALSSTTVTLGAPAVSRIGFGFWGPDGATTSPEGLPGDRPYHRAVSQLIAAADSGEPHPCGARLGAEVTSVLAAAQRFLERPDETRGERP